MWLARVVLLLLVLATYTSSQAFHTITVGVKGSFYDPPTTNALEGDVVTFIFGGVIHGVTQSSFAQPCSPLPGGFSSGLLGTNGSTTTPAPTWDIVISNSSEPIWFFCEATRPESHCASGMVGAINAPADIFPQFQSAAKAVTGTPAPTPTVVLSGIGAFATASPSTNSLAGSSIPESLSQSPTPTPSAPFSIQSSSASDISSKKSFPIGAVVGGVVGGGTAAVIIIVLLFFLHRQKKKRTLEERRYITEKVQHSPSAPRIKRRVSESITGSDMSESEAGRVCARVHHQASSGGLSSNLESLAREPTMRTSRANANALPVDNLDNVNHAVDQGRSILNRYANSQNALKPITMADAFNLSPTPHPYAQAQYTQQSVSRSSPTGIADRGAANVHEIAKEVAALIGSGHTESPGLFGHSAADTSLPYNHTSRQLPNPRHFLQAKTLTEEPESPGLPRYER